MITDQEYYDKYLAMTIEAVLRRRSTPTNGPSQTPPA